MLKELVTRFGFELDDRGLKELEEGIEAVKEGILHLGEALIGEAVGLYELVGHAAEAGVQLKILSQETGLTAEKLQELQFRAKLADVSTEELNQSMNFLARNMEQARQGSEEVRRHFRLLGISTAEIRAGTISTAQVMERISRTFERMPDGPRKTGLAMEIFGRSGARMVPFLNSLHRELSPVNREILEMSLVTGEQIEQSEEFHVNLETLKTAITGIARVVGFGLIPVSTEIIEQMKAWIVQNRQLIVTNLTEFVKGMASALKVTVRIVDVLIKSFSGFANSIGGVKIATELLLGTFAVLSGLTVLYGIGKVSEAVVALGNSFAVANLEAAAIPIAIGAAMVAVFLIMEDIYSFFTGKKSLTGLLLDKIPEVGKVFKTAFEPIYEPLVNLITMVTGGIGTWKDLFVEIGVLIVNVMLTPLRTIVSMIGAIAGIAGRLTNSDKLKGFAEAAQNFADSYLKIHSGPEETSREDAAKKKVGVVNGLQSEESRPGGPRENTIGTAGEAAPRVNTAPLVLAPGLEPFAAPAPAINLPKAAPDGRQPGALSPETAPAARAPAPAPGALGVTPREAIGGPTSIARQVNNDVKVTQQFNFPPGTDPVTVGDKISTHVSQGLDDVLRSTNRSTFDGGAY